MGGTPSLAELTTQADEATRLASFFPHPQSKALLAFRPGDEGVICTITTVNKEKTECHIGVSRREGCLSVSDFGAVLELLRSRLDTATKYPAARRYNSVSLLDAGLYVYACLYVCMYVCTYACMYVCVYACWCGEW